MLLVLLRLAPPRYILGKRHRRLFARTKRPVLLDLLLHPLLVRAWRLVPLEHLTSQRRQSTRRVRSCTIRTALVKPASGHVYRHMFRHVFRHVFRHDRHVLRHVLMCATWFATTSQPLNQRHSRAESMSTCSNACLYACLYTGLYRCLYTYLDTCLHTSVHL